MSKLKKAKVYAQGKAPVISTILGTITLLGAGVYSSIQSYKLANIKNPKGILYPFSDSYKI